MKKILSIILASIALTSCVDTVILPDDKTVDEDMWKTASDVAGIVDAAYKTVCSEALMRNYIVWGDFRSDELVISSSAQLTNSSAYKVDLNQIFSLNINPSNKFADWDALYSAINYCNLVLEKAQGVMDLDPNYTRGDYESDCSKVKALRAMCYFYLVRVFRDVPVTNGVYMSSSQETQIEQKNPAEVLQMCIDDLLDAEKYALSSSTYPVTDWRNKGYLTRDGIRALLADIYLWRASVNHSVEDYQTCVSYCDMIINAKKASHILKRGEEEKEYYLADYEHFYSEIFGISGQNAEESIFELQFNSSTATAQGVAVNVGLEQMYYKFYNNNSSTPYLKTTTNYAVFGASANSNNLFKTSSDCRMNEFFYNANSTSETQFSVRKFVAEFGSISDRSNSGTTNFTNFYHNWIIYRLTDIMLMKAEALVQLYEMNGRNDESVNKKAFALVTFVNKRALPEESPDTLNYNIYKDKMETLVLQERARELCFEGKRWFDLMRYNYRHVNGVQYDKTFAEQGGSYVSNYDEMLKIAVSKYSSTAMTTKMPTEPYLYWPINTTQMDYNTKLIQNPVWRSSTSTIRQ